MTAAITIGLISCVKTIRVMMNSFAEIGFRNDMELGTRLVCTIMILKINKDMCGRLGR